jgi:hypothetical protein
MAFGSRCVKIKALITTAQPPVYCQLNAVQRFEIQRKSHFSSVEFEFLTERYPISMMSF